MARHVQRGRWRENEETREKSRAKERGKTLSRTKEFEIFDDTYVYGSRENENGDGRRIHHRGSMNRNPY